MNVFYPYKKKAEVLQASWRDRVSMPLPEAAQLLGVKPAQVQEAILQMKKRGLFTDRAPAVDPVAELVVRDEAQLAYGTMLGLTEMVRAYLEEADLRIPTYSRLLLQMKMHSRRRRLGEAASSFAENLLSGKKFSENLLDVTQAYSRKAAPNDVPEGEKLQSALAEMKRTTEQLHGFLRAYPGEDYAEECRDFLIGLRAALSDWMSVMNTGIASEENESLFTDLTLRLYEKYPGEYAAMLAYVRNEHNRAAETPPDSPQRILQDYIHYLEEANVCIRDERVRRAVLNLKLLLVELRDLYAALRDGYATGDVRSLKGVYLPTLRSLVEKYVTYEQAGHTGSAQADGLDDTLQLLENDLPTALMHIRDELRAAHTNNMEDEAVALRQKLVMDGMLKSDAVKR